MAKVLNEIQINNKTFRKIEVEGETQYIIANEFYEEITFTLDELKKLAHEIFQECHRQELN